MAQLPMASRAATWLQHLGGAVSGGIGQGSEAKAKTMFKRALRDPLAVFLAAALLIFAAYFLVQRGQSNPVRYTPEIAQSLAAEFRDLTGRPATAADKARLRDDYIGEELLFREAVDRGMHLGDPQVRERLVDRLRFMIVGIPAEPDEQALIDFYASHPGMYQKEPGTSFSHVFYVRKPADSAAILDRLRAGIPVAGEEFWLGRDFPDYGESMIRGMLGQPFVDRLNDLAVGEWVGPIESPRGWHFVRKTGSSARQKLPYAAVRSQILHDYNMARARKILDQEFDKLKEKYDVEITG